MVKAGSYLVLRLAPAFASTPLALVIALAGAFTFAATSAMAISQSNAKKVLAYSTIANLGLIVACSGINTPLAYAAALVVLVYHAISKALLFLCVGTIEQQIGSRHIDAMGGIFFKLPLTTTIAALGMISMMAPPFGMLVGKWMAIVSAGQTPLVLVLLVIGSALTIFFWGKWLGRIVTTAYHEKYHLEKIPRTMSAALVVLGAMVLVAGAGVMTVYRAWLRPLAISTLSHVYLQPDSLGLLQSVDSFMGWPIMVTLLVVVLAGLASFFGLRRTQVRLPYLCGENVVVGTRTFEFRSVMDQRTTAQVTSYYFTHLFGEETMTRWANLVALLILLSLFARVSLA
jgi:ech hydrogenase subunit A